MFGQIGPLEIALVLIIALIVFGPKRLPELGKSLGKGINEFRDGISNLDSLSWLLKLTDRPVLADAFARVPWFRRYMFRLFLGETNDPAVHEITDAERAKVAEDDAETVDAEVVTERHD